jgi:toxin-antitoxin system PIN domain toxin
MPASGATKLLDANVWLALVFSNHVHHPKANAWMAKQANGSCVFCRVTQMALLRHLTNSKIMGTFVQSQQGAWQTYDVCARDARVTFLDEPIGIEAAFRNFSRSQSPAHSTWTDNYLIAFASSAKLGLVSFDKGLTRIPQVQVELLA